MVRFNLRRLLPAVAIRMTPCRSCGIINPFAERHPHPDIVRGELAQILREKHKAQKAEWEAFRNTLRLNMRYDVDMTSHSLLAEFTRQRLEAGERYLREQQNRKNGGTITN